MVEIIPKPISKPPFWRNTLLYLSISLLVVSILGYFVLDNFQNKTLFELEEVKQTLAREKTEEERELENKVLEIQQKIQDFSVLLNEHKKTSNFFEVLEKSSHPQVQFLDLALNLSSDVSQVEISGQTDNFQILGQQLLIFQKANEIEEIELSDLFIGKEGKIEFTFNLSLASGLLR